MATSSVLAGDPQLSQNAGQAQTQWRQPNQRTVQFTGLDDATAAAGQAPNPTSAAEATNPSASGDLPRFANGEIATLRPQTQPGPASAPPYTAPGGSSGSFADPPPQATSHLRTVGNEQGYRARRQQGYPGWGQGLFSSFANVFRQGSGLRGYGAQPGAQPPPPMFGAQQQQAQPSDERGFTYNRPPPPGGLT